MRASTTSKARRTRGIAAAVLTASVMALSVLGAGTALAKVPNWSVGHGTSSNPSDPQPASGASSTSVSAGKQVGFFEWIKNGGPSNISKLFVDATTTPSATVVGASWTIQDAAGAVVGSGTCPTATPLACSFGALRAGNTLYLVASFAAQANLADGSTQAVHFEFTTSGNVPGGNNSHGDAISIDDSVGISSNNDAAGDFNFDQASLTVADNQNVSNSNKQATSVTVNASVVGASVGDSPSLTTPCNATLTAGFPSFFTCAKLTSLTSTVEVGNGKTFSNPNGAGTPGIKVLILFKHAPSQLHGAHPFVYHYWTDAAGAHAELVTATCALGGGFPTNTGPCLIVGSNKVTVWLTHNGNARM